MPAANVLPKPSNLTLRGGGVDAARPRDGVADARDTGARSRPARTSSSGAASAAWASWRSRSAASSGRTRSRWSAAPRRSPRRTRSAPSDVIDRKSEDVVGAGARDHQQGRRRHRLRALRRRTRGRRRSRSLRWGGRLVVCGASTGFEAVTDLRFLWNKQQNLLGSHLSVEGRAGGGAARGRGRAHQAGDRPRLPARRGRQGPGADGGPQGAGQARVRAVTRGNPGFPREPPP